MCSVPADTICMSRVPWRSGQDMPLWFYCLSWTRMLSVIEARAARARIPISVVSVLSSRRSHAWLQLNVSETLHSTAGSALGRNPASWGVGSRQPGRRTREEAVRSAGSRFRR